MSDIAMEKYVSEFNGFSLSQKLSVLDILRKQTVSASKKIKLAKGIKKDSFISDSLLGIVADNGQTEKSILNERLNEYESAY